MPRWFFILFVFLVMQLLLWLFARSLRFLLGDRPRRHLTASIFVLADGLLLVTMTRLFPVLFIVQAWMIASLWLWFMVAAVAYPLYRIGRRFAPQRAARAIAARTARGVPAATPQAPATMMTEIVARTSRVVRKVMRAAASAR